MTFSGTLEDRREIEQILTRYAYAVDIGDEEDLLVVFTDDGICDSPLGTNPGRTDARPGERVQEFARRRGIAHAVDDHRTRHVITNLRLEGSSEEAIVSAYLVEYGTWRASRPPNKTPTTEFLFTGEYHCTVRRVDGKWLIVRRTVHLDSRPYAYAESDVPPRVGAV